MSQGQVQAASAPESEEISDTEVTMEFPAFFTTEEFDNAFHDGMFFIIDNKEAALRLREDHDLINYYEEEMMRVQREKYKIKEIMARPDDDERYYYVLTHEGSNSEDAAKLWFPCGENTIPGEGIFLVCSAADTQEGRKYEHDFLQWRLKEQDEIFKIQDSMNDYLGWKKHLEVHVPGRKEPSLIEVDALVQFIGDTAVLIISNLLAEQYSYDADLKSHFFSHMRSEAVVNHLEAFMQHSGKLQLKEITPLQYEQLKDFVEQEANDATLDKVLGSKKPAGQRRKKPVASGPVISP